MPGPARAGLFVYAKDKDRLSRFYQAIAGMMNIHETNELAVLQSPDIQLLIHQIPKHAASDIEISVPPVRRTDAALKFFFTVSSLRATRLIASGLGGEVFNENWQGPGFVVCNAIDPEGNVFQVRESEA